MTDNEPKSGDDCPGCDGGHLIVYSGHARGSLHVRYLRCWQCGADGGKQVVPTSTVPKRRKRKRPN
jgi:hypothetical protein